MATIGTDEGGHRRILFVAADGKRKTIRLGRASLKTAVAVKIKIEALAAAAMTGQHADDETARWAAGLKPKMRRRLEKAGLVKPAIDRRDTTLGDLFREFLADLSIKSATLTTYKQTEKSMLDFFTAAKPLREIDTLAADKWRQSMKAADPAGPTISRRVKTARQAFAKAVRWKMIADNPFDGMLAGSQSNKARQYFVTRDMAQKIIDQCPDAEWRAIIALSRYGGLRCPSEVLLLKLADVDWVNERILVTSPKTERYKGGESRVIPLFPELRPFLKDVEDTAEPGTVYLVNRYRDHRTANLRTQMLRFIKRAGLSAWPKPFHNMRSSRQTELEQQYPSYVACAWMGNSEKVSRDHYLQMLDGYYDRASFTDFSRDEKAAHKPAHHTATQSTTWPQSTPAQTSETRELVLCGSVCGPVGGETVTPTGFVTTTDLPSETGPVNKTGTNSGTLISRPGRYTFTAGRVRQRVPRTIRTVRTEQTRALVRSMIHAPS